MFKQQHGVCALCLLPAPSGHALCVDHSHTTGKVRGLLCKPCNRAIGSLGDDAAALHRAYTYLLKSEANQNV